MEKLQLDYELNKQVKKEKVLWYKISYFEKKYGYCDKTNADFSRMLGVSLATIKRWIKKLEKLGLILKVKSSFWDRKLFAIRPENKVENSVDNSTSEPTNEPTNEPIYNKEYKEIKDKNNLVVSNEVIKTEQEIIDNAIQVLNKMYPAEIVKEATSIFELAKNEKMTATPPTTLNIPKSSSPSFINTILDVYIDIKMVINVRIYNNREFLAI